jgi:lipopolysaccharide transport system permease protein
VSTIPTTVERSGTAHPPSLRITPPSCRWAPPFDEPWDYRKLLNSFVWRDIEIRYKRTAVGAAWAVIQPFLAILAFSLFFGKVAHIPCDGLPYPIFITALCCPGYLSRPVCKTL